MAEQYSTHLDIDLDCDGINHSTVWLNYSSQLSASGRIGIPISRIRNGDGPTVLLLAGTHGDEYEGQIALRRLSMSIDHKTIVGTIIIMPSLNYPAVQSGTRLSPLDNANLFRSYSGNVELQPTPSIANFVKQALINRADFIVDLHSGGTSIRFLASSQMFLTGDNDYDDCCKEMLLAFNAPYGIISTGVKPRPSSLFGIAAELKKPFITTELGGATGDETGVQIALDGVFNILGFSGLRTPL